MSLIKLTRTGLCLLFISCLSIGPAYPEKDAKLFLSKENYSKRIIKSVVELRALSNETIKKLIGCENNSVRFLIAKNSNVPEKSIHFLMNDKHDFVRSGVAQNLNITKTHVVKLFRDPSNLVYSALARNSSISKKTLLKLRYERKVNLHNFAQNYNCPRQIIIEIQSSDDELAKRWLNITKSKKN